MARKRDFKKYRAIQHTHPSLDSFLEANAASGIHSITVGESEVDLIFDERENPHDILLVYFPGGAGSQHTYPHFQGRITAKRLGVSLLTVSDPAIAKGPEFLTNFYLGHSELDLPYIIDKTIEKFAKGRRLLFVGPSAGGFSALQHGSRHPSSLSFVINPVTNLLSLPSFVEDGKESFFSDISFREIAENRQLLIKEVSNHVIYAQNIGDAKYIAAHMVPFFEKNIGNENIAVQWGTWGRGHVGMPSNEQFSTLQSLIKTDNWDDAVAAAGKRYKSLLELQSDRADLWSAVTEADSIMQPGSPTSR